tara:strand:+ start:146 stop:757 length:612 start_codon:yes stop_codon:yes gene_type:complete
MHYSRSNDYIFFFDIETTGLPKKTNTTRTGFYPYNILEGFDSSRMVSIAWMIYDKQFNLIKQQHFIVLPDNFISTREASKVHGITLEIGKKRGIPIQEIFKELTEDLDKCSLIVAYNIIYDCYILLSECYRYKQYNLIEKIKIKKQYCCFNKVRNHPYFQPKRDLYPKLDQVIYYLFNESMFDYDDNPLNYTYQCARVYFDLF